MITKKRILILGAYGELGGVKTHVHYLKHVLKLYAQQIKVTRGAPFLRIIKENVFFRPEIIVYNLSVYKNQVMRNVIIRHLMSSPNTKHILHLHGGSFQKIHLADNLLWRMLLKFHFHRFDKIFCLTREQYSAVSSFLKDLKILREVYNYIQIPDETQLRKDSINLNLLFMGRLHPQKGVMEAVKAVQQLKEEKIRLWIIGAGELESQLEKIRDPRIVFLGKKTGREKNRYLAEAHVFLLPSKAEGLPYALLEAASYGLALIATRVGAIDKVLIDGQNGFYIHSDNVEMITQRIQQLFLDRKKLKLMGEESRRISKESFPIDHLQNIYDELFFEWYS